MTNETSCDKEEATSALIKAGYPAAIIDGIVMIDNSKELKKKDIQKISRLLREINYHASWGYHGWCK